MLNRVVQITPLDRETLQLLVADAPSRAIAARLGVAVADLDPHLARLFASIGATSQVEAIAIAIRRGLVTAP